MANKKVGTYASTPRRSLSTLGQYIGSACRVCAGHELCVRDIAQGSGPLDGRQECRPYVEAAGWACGWRRGGVSATCRRMAPGARASWIPVQPLDETVQGLDGWPAAAVSAAQQPRGRGDRDGFDPDADWARRWRMGTDPCGSGSATAGPVRHVSGRPRYGLRGHWFQKRVAPLPERSVFQDAMSGLWCDTALDQPPEGAETVILDPAVDSDPNRFDPSGVGPYWEPTSGGAGRPPGDVRPGCLASA